jgi:hypothetical protein
MNSTIDKIIDASIRRLASDRENGFAFLRQVPCTHVKLFVSYWDQAEADYWDKYLKMIRNQYWGVTPNDFDKYVERMRHRWEHYSDGIKYTLGMMFAQKGKVPSYMRGPEVTDEMLNEYAKHTWPTERDIIKVFRKHFEMELLHREGSSEYRISVKREVDNYETRLIVSAKLKFISYYHILNHSEPFMLIDHTGSTAPVNWDLVLHENMESAALLLKNIVNTFENGANQR